MLDLHRLHVLATLAAEGTMTAAAARLHMTTSAVSQHVAQLEREVKVPLLVRHGRRVVLNEAGLALVGHYPSIAEAVEEAEAHVRSFQVDVHGTIALSTFPSFCSTVLPDALMRLRRAYPDLHVTVRDMEPIESIDHLCSGQIDVAVIDDLHPMSAEGISLTVLARDEVVLLQAPSRDIPTSISATARLRDYADAPWILDTEASAFARHVRSLCRAAGFEPKVVANCSNLVASLGLVRAGFGVALMSELNLGAATRDLDARPVDPPCSRTILVATRVAAGQAPSVQAVIRALQRTTRVRQHSASSG